MDKEEFENYIMELSNILEIATLTFFCNNFGNEEQNINDLINILLSSHMSSLVSLMKSVSGKNENIRKEVEKFVEGLFEYVGKNHSISFRDVKRDLK